MRLYLTNSITKYYVVITDNSYQIPNKYTLSLVRMVTITVLILTTITISILTFTSSVRPVHRLVILRGIIWIPTITTPISSLLGWHLLRFYWFYWVINFFNGSDLESKENKAW